MNKVKKTKKIDQEKIIYQQQNKIIRLEKKKSILQYQYNQIKYKSYITRLERDLAIFFHTIKNYEDSFKKVFNVIQKIITINCGAIYFFDKENINLEIKYLTGLKNETIKEYNIYSINIENVQFIKKEKFFLLDFKILPRLLKSLLYQENINAIYCFPLKTKKNLIGILCIGLYQHFEISADILNIIIRISSQLAGVIERLKNEKQLFIANQHIRLINELYIDNKHNISFDRLIKKLCKELKKIYQLTHISFWWRKTTTNIDFLKLQYIEINRRIQKNIEKLIGKKLLKIKIPLYKNSIYSKLYKNAFIQVFSEKKDLLKFIKDIEIPQKNHFHLLAEQIYNLLNYKYLLFIPIIINTKVIGHLKLHRNFVFTSQEIEKIKTIISEISTIYKSHQIEENMIKAKNLAELYLDAAGTMLVSLDKNGRITLLNKKGYDILGYEKDTLIGKNWFDTCIPKSKIDETKKIFNELLIGNTDVPYYHENSIITKTGEERIIGWQNTPLYNDNGEIESILSSGEDLTVFSVAVKELLKSEETFRTIINSTIDFIVILDKEGIIININKAFSNLLNHGSLQLIGKSFWDYCPDYKIDEYKKNLETILKTGKKITYESSFIKDNKEHIFENIISPIIGDDEEIYRIAFLSRDISNRKIIEDEFLKKQKLDSLGIFAGGIAHDFNNILTAIMTNASLALSYLKEDSNLKEIFNEIEKAVDQAKNLTDQLLTFSKGQSPLRELASIKTTIIDTVKFVLSGPKTKYKLYIPDNLWNTEINIGQISQAIQNIVINAEQSMKDGGIIEIYAKNIFLSKHEITDLPAGEYVQISIVDQGTGIPKEVQKKIFDPYFSTKKHGNGLGLAVTYSIIQNHGGTIYVESEVGKGTVITVLLPAVRQKLFEEKNQEDMNNTEFTGQGRILLMDDSKVILKSTTKILSELGYEVITAEKGYDAVFLYKHYFEKKEKIDLVILDLTMPDGMSGEKCLEYIKKFDSQVKAIISTGYHSHPVINNYKDYGFIGVLSKPYSRKDIIKILKNLF